MYPLYKNNLIPSLCRPQEADFVTIRFSTIDRKRRNVRNNHGIIAGVF